MLAWKGPTAALARRVQAARGDRAVGRRATRGRLLAGAGLPARSTPSTARSRSATSAAPPCGWSAIPAWTCCSRSRATPAAIERAIAATGIPRDEFTAESLTEFVRRFEERTGAAGRARRPVGRHAGPVTTPRGVSQELGSARARPVARAAHRSGASPLPGRSASAWTTSGCGWSPASSSWRAPAAPSPPRATRTARWPRSAGCLARALGEGGRDGGRADRRRR